MSGTITWQEFLEYSENILKISDWIGDGWRIEGCKDIPGGAYLVKSSHVGSCYAEFQVEDVEQMEEEIEEKDDLQAVADPGSAGTALQVAGASSWEYNVLYSPSFAVPVLYFNAWKADGCSLLLEDVWKILQDFFQDRLQLEKWSILTQKEHPILQRPFFYLHPCSTAQLMSCFKEHSWNPLVTWLSSVGPSVGLVLSSAYCTPKLDVKVT